ncbi:MAG: glycosyl transferase family 8 [Bacteroidota bacterium]|nr:glycosyl transferase family 8 [Bacteroidota bacterium]
MQIAITLNEKYLIPACVMLTSLFENNPQNNFHVHVITDFKSSKISLLKYILNKYKQQYTIYNLDEKFLRNIQQFKITLHAQLANYYRLFLTEILSPGLNKILYLDVDMIITSDITPLYNINLDNAPLAAVSSNNKELNSVLNIPQSFEYFNSGVLLINLQYFREHHLAEQFAKYITQNPDKITFWDQDVLNALLYEKRIPVGREWNVAEDTLATNVIPSVNIIHYTGMHKPWNKPYCSHPLRDEYFKYLAKNKIIYLADKFLSLRSRIINKLKK